MKPRSAFNVLVDPASAKMFQEERPQEDARYPAKQHIAQRAPGNIFASDLRRHKDQLHRRREHQSNAHGDRSRHAEKKHQDRHCNSACAHAGERDEQRDEESDNVLHLALSIPLFAIPFRDPEVRVYLSGAA